MSHELLYTSAPQGLKPGTYGFCTVLATEGIPKVLQDRLESLSGYEHPFSLTDARASLNPVNYSHLTVTVANQRLHLLSRIADAGADYSGRSNKIAYHLVLQPSEVSAASPAEVLAAPGVCKTGFDGAPRWLPPGALPLLSAGSFGVCGAWAKLCGDAGWAGVLAQRTLKDPAKPITLIFAPGVDVLPLVVEALGLLPADIRWRTSFSTFFTKLPAGMDCQWRFVLDGTPAADQARRNLQLPPINLVAPGPVQDSGPLVDAARSGRAPAGAGVTVPTMMTATRSIVVAPSLPQRTVLVDNGEPGAATVRPPTLAAGSPAIDDLFGKQASPPRGVLYGVIAGVAALAILVGVASWALSGRTELAPIAEDKTKIEVAPEVVVEKSDALRQLEAAQAAEKLASKQAPPPAVAVAPVVAPPKEIPVETVKPVVELPPVFKNLEAKGLILSLPKLERGLLAVSSTELPAEELCKIYVENPADCTLELVSAELFEDEQRLRLIPDEQPGDGQQGWTVQARSRKSGFGDFDVAPIGRFVLHDASQAHALTFAWANEIPDWANPFGLEYCKLVVGVGDEQAACQLSKPKIIQEPVKLRLQTRGDKIPLDIPVGSLASFEKVRFDLELRLGKFAKLVSQQKADESNAAKILIPGDGSDGTLDVEFDFRFIPPGKSIGAAFSCAAYIFPAYLDQVPEKPEWKKVIKRIDDLDDLFKKYDNTLRFDDGVVVADIERLRKLPRKDEIDALKMIKRFTDKLNEMKQRLETLAGEKPDTLTNQEKAELSTLPKGIAVGESWIAHWNNWVDFNAAQNKWVGHMKKRLNDLEKSVEVRYSVYLDFGAEKAVIVRTEPAPGQAKATSVEPPPEPESTESNPPPPDPPDPNPPESKLSEDKPSAEKPKADAGPPAEESD